METHARNKAIYIVNNVFFLTGILFSFKLWHQDREFPLLPVFKFGPVLPAPFDLILAFALPSLLALSLFISKKGIRYAILLLMLFLLLQDQMRWQPWAYHFLIFFLPFCLWSLPLPKNSLSYFQLALIGIYLWSGIHKLNFGFIENVFPRFMEGITDSFPEKYLPAGYLIPILEIAVALGLFFTRTRKAAVILGTLSHLLILSWLTPSGGNTNYIILPWNMAMIAFLLLCFYNVPGQISMATSGRNRMAYLKYLMIICVFLLPVLNFWGKWDHYLSFNLYSGKNKLLFVAVEESEVQNLPYDFSRAYLQIPGLEGGKIIDCNKWSFQQLHVPVPPDKRIYNRLGNHFCAMGIPENKIMILEFDQPVSAGSYRNIPCSGIR